MEVIIPLFAFFWMLLVFGLCVAAFAAWVHGLILAFRASIILGIVCIFFEIPFLLFGIVYWVTRVDLPQKIVEWFEDNAN